MNWKTLGCRSEMIAVNGILCHATCYQMLLVLVPDAVPESRFRSTVKVPNYPVTPCCGVLHILDLSRDAECERHPWQQNESQILRLEKVMGCGSRRGAGFFRTCVLEILHILHQSSMAPPVLHVLHSSPL